MATRKHGAHSPGPPICFKRACSRWAMYRRRYKIMSKSDCTRSKSTRSVTSLFVSVRTTRSFSLHHRKSGISLERARVIHLH